MMKNKFDYLRIDGRKNLPEPWYDYPVLSDFETASVYRYQKDYLNVLVGQQDGYWVAGITIQIEGFGAGFYPGRKWGQFATRENAILWGLGYMFGCDKIKGAAQNAVRNMINEIRQLSLF